jgi:flavin-binding protein dodecin
MVEKTIELTGSSATSIEDAVSLAVSRAAVTISGIYHVEITDISAQVEEATFPVKDRVHE